MGIGLSIVFSGLCALVTDGATGPGQVVLVDTRNLGEVGGVSLPAHAPTLVVALGDLVNPDGSGPDRVVAGWPGGQSAGQVGFWDLTGSEVRIRVQGQEGSGLRVVTSGDGESEWPSPPRQADDASAWRDIRYVADMASIVGDGRIDPTLLTNAGGALPRGIAARVYLNDGWIESGPPSLEEYRHEVFEFAGQAARGALRQALTDTIRWNLETGSRGVVIEIARVADGAARRLILKPSRAAHELFVGNLPAHDSNAHAQHALGDDALAARHFGAYYELLREAPEARPLPRLVPANENRGTGIFHGPFCPPARFRAN